MAAAEKMLPGADGYARRTISRPYLHDVAGSSILPHLTQRGDYRISHKFLKVPRFLYPTRTRRETSIMELQYTMDAIPRRHGGFA